MPKQIKNTHKLKAILLHIINSIGAKYNGGKAVILTILYFIEVEFYQKYEEKLMGLTYTKEEQDPVPEEFDDAIKEMEDNGEIITITTGFDDHRQYRYLALKKENLSGLSKQEIDVAEGVTGRLSGP